MFPREFCVTSWGQVSAAIWGVADVLVKTPQFPKRLTTNHGKSFMAYHTLPTLPSNTVLYVISLMWAVHSSHERELTWTVMWAVNTWTAHGWISLAVAQPDIASFINILCNSMILQRTLRNIDFFFAAPCDRKHLRNTCITEYLLHYSTCWIVMRTSLLIFFFNPHANWDSRFQVSCTLDGVFQFFSFNW